MKFLPAFVIIIILFGLNGCVSVKKYNYILSETKAKDSLINDLKRDRTNLYQSLAALDNRYFEAKEELLKAQLQIQKYSNAGKILEDLRVPILPIPPPQPTNNFLFTEIASLKRFSKYSQVDSLISRAFKVNNYSKVYLAVENGGFAIATDFEEIDISGNKINSQNSKNSFSVMDLLVQRLKDVFFSKTGYYRSIIIVVSPNLYKLGGSSISYDELKEWLDEKTIKLPDVIANSNIDKPLQMVALLYEFEQNENTNNKIQIIDETRCLTKMSNNSLIKTLLNGN